MISNKLFKRALKCIPGGVNSPVRAFASVGTLPVFIKKGHGCRIIDADDKEYIDYLGSWGPLILGHAHHDVIQTIIDTARMGTSFGAPTELEIQLAEKIIDMVPSVDMVRMVNSGTEATMSAVRLARGYTNRNKIIKFEGCYHGHGDSFLIKAGSGGLTLGVPTSPGVPEDFAKHTLNATFNDLDSVENLFHEYSADIAAVIVEPIAGNMGVIPPKEGFLPGLRSLCDENKCLLIFDEVMTGFRVHPGGAQSLYRIDPDLTTLGKVIGGGLPVGAYGGKKEIMEMIAPSGPVYQAGTLSGNPLAVAAGLKTLQLISEPGFFNQLNRNSNLLFNGILDLIKDYDLPLTLNWVNSMGCLFFNESTVTNFDNALESDTHQFATFFKNMLDEGIYIAPSQYEAWFVSAAHTKNDIEDTLDSLKRVFKRIM